MTFSYNLVLALFLLAPGFAAFAGLFFSSQRERNLHPAPPAPTSVLTLALVTLAALLLHGVWATILFVQDLLTEQAGGLSVPFNPNAYAALAATGHETAAAEISGGDIAAILLHLLFLSAAGYLLAIWAVTSRWAEVHISPFLYGWAAEVVRQVKEPGYVHLVTAFVLTSIDGEETAFGYEGLLQNMTLSSDKEITSITLTQVTAFFVELKAGEFKRRALPNTSGIPNLYIPKDQIRNVSFTVFRAAIEAGEVSSGRVG